MASIIMKWQDTFKLNNYIVDGFVLEEGTVSYVLRAEYQINVRKQEI